MTETKTTEDDRRGFARLACDRPPTPLANAMSRRVVSVSKVRCGVTSPRSCGPRERCRPQVAMRTAEPAEIASRGYTCLFSSACARIFGLCFVFLIDNYTIVATTVNLRVIPQRAARRLGYYYFRSYLLFIIFSHDDFGRPHTCSIFFFFFLLSFHAIPFGLFFFCFVSVGETENKHQNKLTRPSFVLGVPPAGLSVLAILCRPV